MRIIFIIISNNMFRVLKRMDARHELID